MIARGNFTRTDFTDVETSSDSSVNWHYIVEYDNATPTSSIQPLPPFTPSPQRRQRRESTALDDARIHMANKFSDLLNSTETFSESEVAIVGFKNDYSYSRAGYHRGRNEFIDVIDSNYECRQSKGMFSSFTPYIPVTSFIDLRSSGESLKFVRNIESLFTTSDYSRGLKQVAYSTMLRDFYFRKNRNLIRGELYLGFLFAALKQKKSPEIQPLIMAVIKQEDYQTLNFRETAVISNSNRHLIEVWMDERVTLPLIYGPELGLTNLMKVYRNYLKRLLIAGELKTVIKSQKEMSQVFFRPKPDRVPTIDELISL